MARSSSPASGKTEVRKWMKEDRVNSAERSSAGLGFIEGNGFLAYTEYVRTLVGGLARGLGLGARGGEGE